LDGADLDDFVLEALLARHGGRADGVGLGLGGRDEVIDNLRLLDGERKKEDLVQRLDHTSLHETAELGHGDPLNFVSIAASTTATAVTTASTVITTATTTAKSTFTSG
jgi:hypothetical protein